MTVEELEEILAHLPADMPVLIGSYDGEHISVVHKHSSGRQHRKVAEHRCETGRCSIGREYETVEHGQYIVLSNGDAYGRHRPNRQVIDEPPRVEITGRWAFKKRRSGQ